MNKYYIEFCMKDSNFPYGINSKEFDTKEQAEKWVYKDIDFIDLENISVNIMRVEYNDGKMPKTFEEEKLFNRSELL